MPPTEKSRRTSPRWLTLILGLLIAVPLLTVWVVVVYFDTEISHDRAEAANLTTARIITRLVNQKFEETFDHLKPYEHDLIAGLKSGNQENVNHTLEKILFSHSMISGIALYEPEGKGIVHLVPPGRMHPGIYCPAAPGMDWSNAKSGVMTPIFISGKSNGMLAAVSFAASARTYTERDLNLLQSVSRQAGIAVENSRLYSSQRNIADTLQETLLTLPDRIAGIDFSHLYRSATETAKVGGDFYDLFALAPGKVGVVIGDVSGKGLEAATLTSMIKNTIRAYAQQDDEPGPVLEKTNELVLKFVEGPNIFITTFFGILDTKSGVLVYSSAGHPPPIVKRRAAGASPLGGGSAPLGIFFPT